MKKKQPNKPNDLSTVKGKHGKAAITPEKPVDEAWERLMKIRKKLGKAASPNGDVMERLAKIGEKIGKDWQSEKSAVEILSEMRR